ncbi:serine/threonine-protein kinase PEPKR2 [Canna indica]|uniref:Serine/threonine-protein kinase PEPKR2 n=1 Tax=Canna indica TaxID=4628 RepID=A0AAQ3KM34_9LILI|nr:serine/threonine-protein kinase PEPKR2 [Canna indica]
MEAKTRFSSDDVDVLVVNVDPCSPLPPPLRPTSKAKMKTINGDREREKIGSCNGGPDGEIVMTAPPIRCSLSGTLARGLKRKLGRIDSATRIGRKKKFEHEYVLGRDIEQGKFGSVRLCWCKAVSEDSECC